MFLGDENGYVMLANVINGAILSRIALHTKEVSQIIYCGKTSYIITAGGDGKICMTLEVRTCLHQEQGLVSTSLSQRPVCVFAMAEQRLDEGHARD
jgi:hypothetical protein